MAQKKDLTLEELLGVKFWDQKHDLIPELQPLKKHPVVCLFFGAQWCSPCINFLPVLIDFYNEINIEEQLLEIIYVSKDKTKEEFDEYTKEMPWILIPFGDSRLKRLPEAHEIKGIPILAVLNKNGEIYNMDGKRNVCEKGYDIFYEWYDVIEPIELRKQKEQVFSYFHRIQFLQEKLELERQAQLLEEQKLLEMQQQEELQIDQEMQGN